jgi:hypothetical protein
MKLTKDQTQKIFLGAMLLVGVVYGFITFLIGPTQTDRDANLKKAAALDPKIAAAKSQINKVKELQAKLPEAEKFAAQVKGMIPEGSPVAWFPPKLGDYFKRQGVDKVAARSNSDAIEKDLPGFRRMNWGVEVPRVEFAQLATAIAELENGEPLLEIEELFIEVNRDEVHLQHANFTINNLVSQ